MLRRNVASRLFGGVNVALARASGEVCGFLPISSISVAGVNKSEYVHGKV